MWSLVARCGCSVDWLEVMRKDGDLAGCFQMEDEVNIS